MDSNDVSADTRLVWFSLLNLDDRVALLADPDAPLPLSLVYEITRDKARVVSDGIFTSNGSPNSTWHLTGDIARLLRGHRDRLLRWWNELPIEDQDVFINHRDGSLPESAWFLARSAPSGVASTIVDSTKHDVSLTPIGQVFLEWKAREKNS
ncbi:hypothetical protein ABZW96_33275 [Nocardia sp. NPDC004168]|uniref:hypothetical protein n=1 Tax=Nocardia sp. NPDC004168 TaxID=3154452 RepID=UPI0033AB9A33